MVAKLNLLKQKTGGCRYCATVKLRICPDIPRDVVNRLRKRYEAIQQRCSVGGHARYSERGIKNLFSSPEEFIRYVWESVPHKDYIGVEIDRIDNDGHYAPGNLRLSTRRENILNRSCTVFSTFRGMKVPTVDVYHLVRTLDPSVVYAPATCETLAHKGISVERIIERFHTVKSCKPRGVYTTLPTPDPAIASLYLTA